MNLALLRVCVYCVRSTLCVLHNILVTVYRLRLYAVLWLRYVNAHGVAVTLVYSVLETLFTRRAAATEQRAAPRNGSYSVPADTSRFSAQTFHSLEGVRSSLCCLLLFVVLLVAVVVLNALPQLAPVCSRSNPRQKCHNRDESHYPLCRLLNNLHELLRSAQGKPVEDVGNQRVVQLPEIYRK